MGSGVAVRHEFPRLDAKAAPALKRTTTASAGERTRTSKGFRPTGPKPVAFANSATPAHPKDRHEPAAEPGFARLRSRALRPPGGIRSKSSWPIPPRPLRVTD